MIQLSKAPPERDREHEAWVRELRICCHDLGQWASIDMRASLKEEGTRGAVLVGRCRVCGGDTVRKPLGLSYRGYQEL